MANAWAGNSGWGTSKSPMSPTPLPSPGKPLQPQIPRPMTPSRPPLPGNWGMARSPAQPGAATGVAGSPAGGVAAGATPQPPRIDTLRPQQDPVQGGVPGLGGGQSLADILAGVKGRQPGAMQPGGNLTDLIMALRQQGGGGGTGGMPGNIGPLLAQLGGMI